MEDPGWLFLRAQLFWTTEWAERDGTAADHGPPSCLGRCRQIGRCWEAAANIEAECIALHHPGLEVPELEVELAVRVVEDEDPSACDLFHHRDSCKIDRVVEEETDEPSVGAEGD